MLFCKCKQEEEKDENKSKGNKLKSVLAVRWVV